MAIEELLRVVAPPDDPTEAGGAQRWADAERLLGTPLPRDLHDVAAHYGSGLRLAFGSLNPALARLPHCICRTDGNGEQVLRTILGIVGAQAGVWGDVPLFNPEGAPYLEPEDGRILDEFVYWKLEANQRDVLAKGGATKLASFIMVIDADTPPAVLARTYPPPQARDSDYHYYEYIERVAQWIPELRWAFIPLSDELEYAMFVVAPRYAGWVRQAELVFSQSKIPVSHLRTVDGGRRVWDDILPPASDGDNLPQQT